MSRLTTSTRYRHKGKICRNRKTAQNPQTTMIDTVGALRGAKGTPKPLEPLIRLSAMAKLLKCTPKALRTRCKKGQVTHCRIMGKYYFTRTIYEDLIDESTAIAETQS